MEARRALLRLVSASLLAQTVSGCAQTFNKPDREPPPRQSQSQDMRAGGIWLDRPPANWNRRMDEPPRPVSSIAAVPMEMAERCRSHVRQPENPAEHVLARAGWMLYGPAHSDEHTLVVTAMSGFDGMCRPLGYQAFVYREGRYAGTLAPGAMNSRTDGALVTIRLESPARIVADFVRYGENDPLCCPSRTSRVIYELNRDDAPVVSPASIATRQAGLPG